MVANDFSAGGLECRERGGPSTNVGRIETFSDGGIMDCKGRGVPGWIVVDDISKPILSF